MARVGGAAWLAFALGHAAFGETASKTPPAPTPPQTETAVDTDRLYEMGEQLFDQLAPPEVKAEYEFPSKEQWEAFAVKLQQALNGDSLDALADYAPQARAALSTLRTLGADDDLADWLEQRLDEAEMAGQAKPQPRKPPAPLPPRRPAPPSPAPPRELPRTAPPATARIAIPYYASWLARVRTRPPPARAVEMMPVLRGAFATEGVPPALAWIAEAESSLNPSARSPAGARGLFQLMPDTAKRLGLGTFLPDERTNPEKSARAAARYLRELHVKFGDWPLAIAAYNAGEGRVSRALTARQAKDFAGIADALPAETRMYVPKVCALVATRTGTPINAL